MDVPATKADITKEWLQKLLDDSKEDIVIEEMQLEPGTKPGENFSAQVLRIEVKGLKNGSAWSSSYIIKLMPESAWGKDIMEKTNVFHKEVESYTKVIPGMISMQKHTSIKPDTPRCLFGKTHEKDGIIVLEDLKPLGYQLADIKKGQDFEHCSLLVKNLAKIHALGYYCKFSSQEPLTKTYETLGHYTFGESKQAWTPTLRSTFKLVSLILDCFPERKLQQERLKKKEDELIDKATSFDKDHKLSTICHGDVWSNNMLYKYGDDGKPTSLILLDLQIMHYGIPTRDLGYFFCMSTNGELRRNHLKELLEMYRRHLFSFLRELGVSEVTEEDLSLDKLWDMYYHQTIAVGFVQGLCSIPILLMPQERQIDPKEAEGLEMEDVVALYHGRAKEVALEDLNIQNRLFDLLDEMMDQGVI